MKFRRARRSIEIALVAAALGACGESSEERSSATVTESTIDLSAVKEPTVRPIEPEGAPLERCADVPLVSVDDAHDGPMKEPLTDDAMKAILDYGLADPERFGGIHVRPDLGYFVVVAVTNDVATHRTALADLVGAAGGSSDGFDVVQVVHTEAELIAASGAALDAVAADFPIEVVGVDVTRNRIKLTAYAPIAEEKLEELAAALAEASIEPADSVCVEAPESVPAPIEPGTPLDAIVPADASGAYPADTLVECGSIRFELEALDDPKPLDQVADPDLLAAFEDWLAGAHGQTWPQDGWALLHESAERGDFMRLADGGALAEFERNRDWWFFSGVRGAAECDLRLALPDGLGIVEWELDPAFTSPKAASTEIHVLATERACASGRAVGDRLLEPQVVESDDAVLIAFAAIAQLRDQTCPSNPSVAVTITLDSPLGNRDLRDGLVIGPLDELLD